MSKEKKTELAVYRESPIEVFLERMQPEDTAEFTKYLKDKMAYLSSERKDFELKLTDAGLNPNDKGSLELVLQRLTDGQPNNGSGLSIPSKDLSIAKDMIGVANNVKNRLEHFKYDLGRIFDAYFNSGFSMEFKNITLLCNPGNNQYGPNEIILQKLSQKKLLIRQRCFEDSRHPDVVMHGALDIKLSRGFLVPSLIIPKARACSHVGPSIRWRDFDVVARKYANFYAQRILSSGDESPRLKAYFKDYLTIPNVLAGKLGLKIFP